MGGRTDAPQTRCRGDRPPSLGRCDGPSQSLSAQVPSSPAQYNNDKNVNVHLCFYIVLHPVHWTDHSAT